MLRRHEFCRLTALGAQRHIAVASLAGVHTLPRPARLALQAWRGRRARPLVVQRNASWLISIWAGYSNLGHRCGLPTWRHWWEPVPRRETRPWCRSQAWHSSGLPSQRVQPATVHRSHNPLLSTSPYPGRHHPGRQRPSGRQPPTRQLGWHCERERGRGGRVLVPASMQQHSDAR